MSNFYLSGSQIHDNTQFWKQNSEEDYVKTIQNLIKSRPFGDRKFYIYSFVKRVDDASGVKKMYHQARLTRPEPLPGTTLMKVDPKDPLNAVIIWTLPNQENFSLYKYGKMFGDPIVYESVQKYLTNPRELIQRDPDDLNDEQIRQVYREIKEDLLIKKRRKLAKMAESSQKDDL